MSYRTSNIHIAHKERLERDIIITIHEQPDSQALGIFHLHSPFVECHKSNHEHAPYE